MRRAFLAVSLIVFVFLMFGREVETRAPAGGVDGAPALVSNVSP